MNAEQHTKAQLLKFAEMSEANVKATRVQEQKDKHLKLAADYRARAAALPDEHD